MNVQEVAALAIAAGALVWLVVRARRKGLDEEEHDGCASCGSTKASTPVSIAREAETKRPRDSAAIGTIREGAASNGSSSQRREFNGP